MSMVGELTFFFLGLQIKQMKEGIFMSHAKYTQNLIKKFGLENGKQWGHQWASYSKSLEDEKGKSVDQYEYWSIIGGLLYLAASRPDIAYSVGMCARYQSDPNELHENEVWSVLRYVNSTTNHGLSIAETL